MVESIPTPSTDRDRKIRPHLTMSKSVVSALEIASQRSEKSKSKLLAEIVSRFAIDLEGLSEEERDQRLSNIKEVIEPATLRFAKKKVMETDEATDTRTYAIPTGLYGTLKSLASEIKVLPSQLIQVVLSEGLESANNQALS